MENKDGAEKKHGGCGALLLKGFIIYLVVAGIFAMVMSNSAEKAEEEVMNETTALMEAGDYQGAIDVFDEYWEEFSIANHTKLADMYVQCFEEQEEYQKAAEIIISVFQEQGYEDAKDGKLHTRLTGLLPKLSKEMQGNVQKALDDLPDTLEEKQAIEKKKKEAEKQAKKEAEERAAELAEYEKEDRKILQSALNGDMTKSETRERARGLCEEYLEKYSECEFAATVKQVVAQFDAIDKNRAKMVEISPDIKIEYEKILGNFYSDFYIDYKLEYKDGMDSIIGKIQDQLGETNGYNDWVAGDLEYFYGTEIPGDTVYIIRTQTIFPEAGGYHLHVIPDGKKRLNRSGGFEFVADVYREVSDDYINEVFTRHEGYLIAEANVENAYYNLKQLGEALKAEKPGNVDLKAVW